MDDKNLVTTENQSFLTKIKNWFKDLFGKKANVNIENSLSSLEFEQQSSAPEPEFNKDEQKIEQVKYQFSTHTVSKQKLEKIKIDLDKSKIGVEELYQLSDEELNELSKMYDNQINDTVSKLNEVELNIEGYKRKIAKIQAQNQ